MTLDIHNWSSSAHQEIYKVVKDEIFLIVNQVDARVQNFEIQFLQEAAKFVRDFQSLANEADESLAEHKALELEIECLLRVVVSQDIMSIVQKNFVVDTSNLQTELEPYIDMQQKIERLQAQLGDQKDKSKDTPYVSNTLDPLSPKLENENVELEFHVSEQKDTTRGTGANTKFAKQSILGKPPFSSRPKLYVVTPLPKSTDFPKEQISRRSPSLTFSMTGCQNWLEPSAMNATVDEPSAMACNQMTRLSKKGKYSSIPVILYNEVHIFSSEQCISDSVATSFQLSQDSRPHAHVP
ncbi:hypothetical protein Tco_0186345 [Tanacetum coccineum]